MRLLVAIHDVTPALAAQVERLWELCAAQAIVPALFVVPDWHGEWPLGEHPAFVAWLRARADDGADVLLHGERHDEVGLARGWRDALRAWGRTAREAEFLTLDEEAAGARIRRGAALLRALRLPPVGFVPPAWLGGEPTIRATAACGLLRGEDVSSVHLHERGLRLPSPVVRWSARSDLRAWISVLVAEARWRLARRHPLVRLGLHPADLDHPGTARSLRASLVRWRAGRQPVTYATL